MVEFPKNTTSQNRSKMITASVCLGLSGCPLSRAEFLCTCAQQLGRLIPNLDRAPAQPYIYLAIHIYMDSLTLCDLSTNEFIAGNIVATEEHWELWSGGVLNLTLLLESEVSTGCFFTGPPLKS